MTHLKYEDFIVTMPRGKDGLKDFLFVAVSGAHAYGWANEKSDLDIRQVFFPEFKQAISIFFRAKTESWMEQNKTLDFTNYPISEYLRLLAKGNGNALENLFQEHLYSNESLVKELRQIVMDNIHQGFLSHYLGYSHSLKKDLSIPRRVEKYGSVKLVLSRYRVLLAGGILAQYKVIEYNLCKQAEYITSLEHLNDLLYNYFNGIEDTKKTFLAYEETEELHECLVKLKKESKLPTRKQASPEIQLDNFHLRHYERV